MSSISDCENFQIRLRANKFVLFVQMPYYKHYTNDFVSESAEW